jgi:hypothetical protein
VYFNTQRILNNKQRYYAAVHSPAIHPQGRPSRRQRMPPIGLRTSKEILEKAPKKRTRSVCLGFCKYDHHDHTKVDPSFIEVFVKVPHAFLFQSVPMNSMFGLLTFHKLGQLSGGQGGRFSIGLGIFQFFFQRRRLLFQHDGFVRFIFQHYESDFESGQFNGRLCSGRSNIVLCFLQL